MRRLAALLLSVALVLFIGFRPAAVEESTPDIERIIEKVDKLYRSDTSYGELEMTIVTPNWERQLRMKIWTKGMDQTFIYVISPKKDAGMATLRDKTEMWNYFPKINKVMKVPPSMMMGSWMGSDFTNDDLVKESSLLRDYDAQLFEPDGADPNYYYLELTPKRETPTVWGKIVTTVHRQDLMPIEEAFYDEKGRKIRVMEFKAIKEFSGRSIPSIMEMTPLNKEEHRTVIRYLDARFDEELDDHIFTLRNLQKRR